MATTDDVRTMLPTLISDIAGVPMELIRPDARFRDDLKIDSLSIAEIIIAAEDAFHVAFPAAELDKLTTVDEVAAYVERMRA